MRVAVDALDNPVRVILSTGQVADIALAVALFQDHATISICADKNYDLDAFVTQITAQDVQPVIPPRANRVHPRDFDRYSYKDRNIIKHYFNRIKQFRYIASR